MIPEGTSLAGYWTDLHSKKGDLLERSEQYARWTIPAIFPRDKTFSETPEESENSNVAIGARLVNHLSHRIVDTMFPNDKPFFAVNLTPEAKQKFEQESALEAQQLFDESLISLENAAMRNFGLTQYRPLAVEAVSLQIVTGNALIFRLQNGVRIVYSVRDYSVTRDIAGELQEVIIRDKKLFKNLPEHIKEAINTQPRAKQYKNEDHTVLYSYYWLEDGKWKSRQAVDDVEIQDSRTSFSKADFPILVLTWNLGRGDHYGRGLVEDYAVTFHNLDIMTEAMIDLIGIASDIKFLVNDTSTFDVDAWNNAKRGEYLPGKEGDITVPQFKFAIEVQFLADSIAKAERELSQAFLLSSAGVRDAERVTAEEIRFMAREIESAFGGLYSRLALDWQKKEAEYELAQLDFKDFLPKEGAPFEVIVVAGLESLSRDGKLESIRLAVADLQMLDAVPQEIRDTINPSKFAQFIFRNRGVDANNFLFTEQQIQERQQLALQQQQELQRSQGEVDVATKAATQ